MNKRKENNINALTNLIQKNELTYALIGEKIKEAMLELDIKNDPWLNYDAWDAEKRISRLALGNRPKANEKLALAYWQFKDPNKWPYLYFPDNQAAYEFILKVFKDEISKVINDEKIIKKWNKMTVRSGITNDDIKPQELTIRLLGLLYLHTLNEVRLGERKRRKNLAKYTKEWFSDKIKVDSPLVSETKIQLRQTLSLTSARKKELKQVVLRQLISVL